MREGETQKGVGAAQLQLVADVFAMMVDRTHADTEQLGDVGGPPAVGDEAQHAAFGGGEVVEMQTGQVVFVMGNEMRMPVRGKWPELKYRPCTTA